MGIFKNSFPILAALTVCAQMERASGQGIANGGFETNTGGVTFSIKISSGFDAAGNDVAGWQNTGPGNNNSGVDYAGDNGITTHDGSVCAWSQGGNPGAYQITGHQLQAGDPVTLTWWAKSSYGGASQKVQLLSATNVTDNFADLQVTAARTDLLNNTGNGGDYTQYTLSYVAGVADAGKYLAVSFCSPTNGNCYACFDDFQLADNSTNISLGPPTVVPIPANPVLYYANDSRFPYLPNSNNTANITFWVDGANFRSEGPSLDTMNVIAPTNSVLSASSGIFDNGGIWLLSAIRRNGVLYGFYHAEDHSCIPYSEWNSTGLATSTDDGATWTKQGQIIGSPNPCGSFGGINACTVGWDNANSRWLAWGGADCFVSSNSAAAVGTWYAYSNGAFNVPMPGSGAATGLPTLSGNISVESVAWNSYLGRWVMVYNQWGDNGHIYYTTSTNGIVWTSQQILLNEGTNGYVQIIGDTGETCGQDALLVYESFPSVANPGTRNRDMIERWIHWGPLTQPATPTNLTANGSWTCQSQIALKWNAVSQAQDYEVLRSSSSDGNYVKIADLATSASFPAYTDLSVAAGVTYYYKVQATNSVGISGFSSVVSATAAGAAAGNVISINIVGGASTTNALMGCDESAGVVASPNWNNAISANGTLSNLEYDAGAASGASATWSSANTWSTEIASTPGNYQMMRGYLDGSTPSVTVSNIPAAFTNSGYNVYVYCDGDAYSGRTGKYTIGFAGIQAVDNSTFGGTFIQASNSAGNYVVFTNLTASSFVLACQGVGGGDGVLRAPVNGLQIVSLAALSKGLPAFKPGLSCCLSNGVFVVGWPADFLGWQLQMQTNMATGLSTNWVDVPESGQATQISFPISRVGSTFFRIISN